MAQSAADRRRFGFRQALPIAVALLLAGCYAPMHSPGTPATDLPDEFRYPMRTMPQPINFSTLTAEQPYAYLLGSGDVLEIAIPDLIGPGQMEAIQVTVLEQGEISLPRVGPIAVGGLRLVLPETPEHRGALNVTIESYRFSQNEVFVEGAWIPFETAVTVAGVYRGKICHIVRVNNINLQSAH